MLELSSWFSHELADCCGQTTQQGRGSGCASKQDVSGMGALWGIFDPWNSWFWPILRNEDSWLIMKSRALFCARHGAALLSILSHVQNHLTRWGNAPLEKRKQCSQRQMTCLESYSWEVGRVRNWFQVCLPNYHPCTLYHTILPLDLVAVYVAFDLSCVAFQHWLSLSLVMIQASIIAPFL